MEDHVSKEMILLAVTFVSSTLVNYLLLIGTEGRNLLWSRFGCKRMASSIGKANPTPAVREDIPNFSYFGDDDHLTKKEEVPEQKQDSTNPPVTSALDESSDEEEEEEEETDSEDDVQS